MSCALWIGKHKVYTAAEVAEYFDLASVRGYFLGGTLIRWLRENGGQEYADKLDGLSKDSPTLNEDIAAVFGVKDIPASVMDGKGCQFGGGSAFGSCLSSGKYGNGFSSFNELKRLLGQLGSFGSFRFGSGGSHEWEWEWLLGRLGSFGSFRFGSGGFHEWEWEWLLGRLGSFGSFRFGSGGFHEWEWEWLLGRLGSFGSFRFGSGGFYEWEWEWLLGRLGSFGSFTYGSFDIRSFFGKYGSFSGSYTGSKNTIDFFDGRSFDEYDLIMLENLIKCPLNGYGYGIHNI